MAWVDVTATFDREYKSMFVGQMVSVDGHAPKSGIGAVELGSEGLDVGSKPHERLTCGRASAKGLFSDIKGLDLIQIMDELLRRAFMVIDRILDPWLALYPCVLLCNPCFMFRNPLLLEFVESLWLLLKQCDSLVHLKLGSSSDAYINYVDEEEIPQNVYKPYRLSNPLLHEQDPLLTLSEALHMETSFIELGKDLSPFTSEEKAAISCRLNLLAALRSFFCAVDFEGDAKMPHEWGRNLFFHAERVVQASSRCKPMPGHEYKKYFSPMFVTSYISPYERHCRDLPSRIIVPDCFCKLVGTCLKFVLMTPMVALGGCGFQLVFWRILVSDAVQGSCSPLIRAFSLQCMQAYSVLKPSTNHNLRLLLDSTSRSLSHEFSSMLGVTAKISVLFDLFGQRESESTGEREQKERELRFAQFDCLVNTIDFASAVMALDIFYGSPKPDSTKNTAWMQLRRMCYYGRRAFKKLRNEAQYKKSIVARDDMLLRVMQELPPPLAAALRDIFSLQASIFWIMHRNASVQAELLSTLWPVLGHLAAKLESASIDESYFGRKFDPESERLLLRPGHLESLHPLVHWLYRSAGPPILCYFYLLHRYGLVDTTWDAVVPLFLEASVHDMLTAIDAGRELKVVPWAHSGLQRSSSGPRCTPSRLLTDLALVASASCDGCQFVESMARSRTDFTAWKHWYTELLVALPGYFGGQLRPTRCSPWMTYDQPPSAASTYSYLVHLAPYSQTLASRNNMQLEDLSKSLEADSTALLDNAASLDRSVSAAALVGTVSADKDTAEQKALQSLQCALWRWGSKELQCLSVLGKLNATELQRTKAACGVHFRSPHQTV